MSHRRGLWLFKWPQDSPENVFLEALVQWGHEAPASAAPREDQDKHGHSYPLNTGLCHSFRQNSGVVCVLQRRRRGGGMGGRRKNILSSLGNLQNDFLPSVCPNEISTSHPAYRSVNPFTDQEVTHKHQCEERGAVVETLGENAVSCLTWPCQCQTLSL